MNKKVNLYLNIFGFISFVLAFSILGMSLKLETLSYHTSYIIRMIPTLIGFLFGILFLSIESFLFILMKNRNKVLYIIYMFIELLIAITISIKIPYGFYIVLPILNIGRDLLRIQFVDKLYIPKEFNKYSKMFGIKIKDFPKKRKTTTIKKKVIDIPITDYNKKTKTTKKTASATSM